MFLKKHNFGNNQTSQKNETFEQRIEILKKKHRNFGKNRNVSQKLKS